MRITPLVRSLLTLVSLLAVSMALMVVPSTAASAAGEEADFVNRLNALRNSVGLPSLAVYGDLVSVARTHSQRMGSQNLLYHNPSLTVEVTNWQSVGENVGYGGSVADIFNAFVNSPAHRANMVSGVYTQVGIGTWIAPTGRIWVTQVFRKPLVQLAPPPAPAPVGFPVSSTLAPAVSAFGGILGAPVGYEYAVPGGIEQDFVGGDVLWGAGTGARAVLGNIRDRYRALAGPRSALGLPTTNELGTPDRVGRYNHFQNGSIYWTPAIGAREVRGAIRGTWSRLGWETSALGYPLTDELVTPDRVGRYNHFQNGSIYWTPAIGAREVRGAIRGRWAATGWELGPLGYPTSDEYAVPNGRRSDFQRGSIIWNAVTGVTTIV